MPKIIIIHYIGFYSRSYYFRGNIIYNLIEAPMLCMGKVSFLSPLFTLVLSLIFSMVHFMGLGVLF